MQQRYFAPLTNAERQAFITCAMAYLHVRWRHQGRSIRGVDCAGLLICAMRDIGKTPLDVEGYSRYPYRNKLREMLRTNLGEPVEKDAMRAGDVALMRFKGDPSHVGVLVDYPLGGLALLHAFAQNKEVTWHRINEQWNDRIVEVYRP